MLNKLIERDHEQGKKNGERDCHPYGVGGKIEKSNMIELEQVQEEGTYQNLNVQSQNVVVYS